jgi:hypothetical protein
VISNTSAAPAAISRRIVDPGASCIAGESMAIEAGSCRENTTNNSTHKPKNVMRLSRFV